MRYLLLDLIRSSCSLWQATKMTNGDWPANTMVSCIDGRFVDNETWRRHAADELEKSLYRAGYIHFDSEPYLCNGAGI